MSTASAFTPLPEIAHAQRDALTPKDILQDLDTPLAHGFGDLRIVVQDGVLLSCSMTTHRRRRTPAM